MAAAYLDDFVLELKQLGEMGFRRRHTSPVLIVTGPATRGERADSGEITRVAPPRPAARTAAPLALLHRVFPLIKAPHVPEGPVSVGRTDENDVPIPEFSISKRHCTFDARDGTFTITDCGSTNGTTLNGAPLQGDVAVPLCGGEVITIGRFSFVFETPAGFLELVSGLVK